MVFIQQPRKGSQGWDEHAFGLYPRHSRRMPGAPPLARFSRDVGYRWPRPQACCGLIPLVLSLNSAPHLQGSVDSTALTGWGHALTIRGVASAALPPRSMVGQLPLEQHIGVRIPGGQPYDNKHLPLPAISQKASAVNIERQLLVRKSAGSVACQRTPAHFLLRSQKGPKPKKKQPNEGLPSSGSSVFVSLRYRSRRDGHLTR
jgi:hypothetical protein